MKKLTLIKDLVSGSSITDVFLLTSATQGQAKNGPYWRLELRDASGSISGKVWSPLSLEYTEMPVGDFLQISARVSSYRDKLELAVIGMKILSKKEQEELSLADFVPSSPYNPATMMLELKDICKKELQYKPWHDFIFGILEDEEIAKKMLVFPAAKGMHHAYAGGLLEHTLSVCRICLMLSEHYPWLDRQLLVAGAICHDLGKIWELTSGLTIDYTDEGRLIGHISLVLDRIKPFISSAKLDDALVLHLYHLILSHHGTLEFGSPKVPSTPEAMILHYADNIDAKMQQMRKALEPVGGEPGWSSYVPSLDRFLYQAEPTPMDREDTKDILPSLNISPADPNEGIPTIISSFDSIKTVAKESFSSIKRSPSHEAFVVSSNEQETVLPDEQYLTSDAYLDSMYAKDTDYANDDILSSFYEEIPSSYEKEDISENKKHSDEECNGDVYNSSYQKEFPDVEKGNTQANYTYDSGESKKDTLPQEIADKNIENSSEIYDFPHDKDSHTTESLEVNERGDHSKSSGTLDNSDPLHSLHDVFSSEKIIEKTEEKVTTEKTSNLQVLSLLDHCS